MPSSLAVGLRATAIPTQQTAQHQFSGLRSIVKHTHLWYLPNASEQSGQGGTARAMFTGVKLIISME